MGCRVTADSARGFEFRAQCDSSARRGDDIRTLWHTYMVGVLGIPADQAAPRIDAEVGGTLHLDLLQGLEDSGWTLRRARVLDVGCGTGALLNALAVVGASPIGIEPSAQWASAAYARFEPSPGLKADVLCADGARIPLASGSVDYVLSLQVLEHMPMASVRSMILEVARVLRPGGRVFLSFENYLSFREPHYRVAWLPYLPKKVGQLYLSIRGRNPAFLRDHVHYNHTFLIMVACMDAGLCSGNWSAMRSKLEEPSLVIGWPQRQFARIISKMPSRVLKLLAIAISERRQLFRTGIRLELGRV